MPLKSELSRWFVEWRLDALGAAALAMLGLVRARELRPKVPPQAEAWWRQLWLAGATLLGGALLAKATTSLLDTAAHSSTASPLTLRSVLIGGTATVSIILYLALRPRKGLRRSDSLLAGRGPRVLVVDDLETNRLLVELFLQRHGFQTELAESGEAAIRRAARGGLDVILMDLHMPETDGLAATRRIRNAEPPGHRVPIFALTASLDRTMRNQSLAAGMDEHLTKPLNVEHFRALVGQYISLQRH